MEEGQLELDHVRTSDQLADMLTKALGRVHHVEMRQRLGVRVIGEETGAQSAFYRSRELPVDHPPYIYFVIRSLGAQCMCIAFCIVVIISCISVNNPIYVS